MAIVLALSFAQPHYEKKLFRAVRFHSARTGRLLRRLKLKKTLFLSYLN